MRTWMKAARTVKGFKAKEVAEQLGITPEYYLMIENGSRQKKLDICVASRLSKILDVPLLQIVKEEAE